MAFVHGKTTSVLVDEFDLSPYLSASTAVKNVQTVNVTAYGANDDAFIAGMESGTLSLGGMYDPASGAVGEILDAAIGAESIVTVVIGGYATLGNKCTMLKAEMAGWQPRSTVNDAVRITANFVAVAESDSAVCSCNPSKRKLRCSTGPPSTTEPRPRSAGWGIFTSPPSRELREL